MKNSAPNAMEGGFLPLGARQIRRTALAIGRFWLSKITSFDFPSILSGIVSKRARMPFYEAKPIGPSRKLMINLLVGPLAKLVIFDVLRFCRYRLKGTCIFMGNLKVFVVNNNFGRTMSFTESPTRTIGYARVSTKGQDLAYQLGKLQAAGCRFIFQEKRSGKNTSERPQLEKMLISLRKGDMVLATATDRVARDPLDLLNILHSVKAVGAGLRLLDEPFIDTTSEMSDLIAFLVGWAARWQRRRILENTAQGRELARQRGVKFGRKPKLTPLQREEVRWRRQKGERVPDIALAFAVSKSTISRVRL